MPYTPAKTEPGRSSGPSRIASLTTELLAEPFSTQAALREGTVREVGTALEEFPPEEDDMIESYRRCQDIYCRLLLELESEGLSAALDEPIGRLADEPSEPIPRPAPADWMVAADALLEPGGSGMPEGIALRLRGQALVAALETGCHDRLLRGIENLWNERVAATRSLLSEKSGEMGLHPELLLALEELARHHGEWLYRGTFSYSRLIEALRYLTAFPLREQFTPALFDYGALILLFGQDAFLGAFPLRNVMRLEGLDTGELVELAFRLSRVQKLKSKFALATSELLPQHLPCLQKDLDRAFELLDRVKFSR